MASFANPYNRPVDDSVMATPAPTREQYTFGRFRLTVDGTLLLDGDQAVRLAPMVLRTLLVLVERAGRVVTKDELMTLVWQGAAVEETGLTRNISVLRTALGDHADAIATVPRVGYRFARPVTLGQAGSAAPAASGLFVGREAEVQMLQTALDAARRGRGACIGLAGEPGIGKTTLADRIVALAQPDCLIGVGRATEVLGTTEPHLPVLEALEMLSSTPQVASDLRRLAPTWASHVRHLQGAAPPATPADTPERLLRELVHFLATLARTQPVLLVLDDVHWADAATTDVVTHLAARLAEWPLLLLVTYRDREFLPPGPPFAHARAELRARRVLQELSLPLLTSTDVAAYVAQVTPELAGTDLAPRVYASSEGNPLFMTALVSYLGDASARTDDAQATRLPESLRGLIARTLDRLTPRHRALLEAAAMQGYTFDAPTVATAVASAELDVEDDLAVIERDHGVITRDELEPQTDTDATARYRFRHALYQAALLEQLTPSRRARLAGAMAEAVLQRAGDDARSVAGPVALLLEQARAYGRAAEQFAIASRRATERLAFRDATDLAMRGDACLERATGLSAREHTRIACALTFAQLIPLSSSRGYGHPEVEALTQRATDLAQTLGDPEATARALAMTCFVRLVRGECMAARDAARQLIALAESPDALPLIVNAHMQAQIACHHLGHFADADVHAAHVMRLGPALAPHARFMNVFDPVVASLAESSRNAWITGRLRSGTELAEYAVALGSDVGNADSMAFAWLFHAWAHGYRGDWRTAVQSAGTGVVIAKTYGTVQTMAWNRCVRGWARAHLGEAAEGRRELEDAMDLSQSIMGEVALPQFRVMRTEVLLLQGDRDAARAGITEALEAAEHHDDAYFAAEVHRLAALCDAPGPHGHSPLSHLDAAFAIARQQGAAFFELRAARTLAGMTGDLAPLREALARIAEPEPWLDIVEARTVAGLAT